MIMMKTNLLAPFARDIQYAWNQQVGDQIELNNDPR